VSPSNVIRRGFLDADHGQVHYRYCGEGPAILLVHASPGSSKQLESLMSALAYTGYSIFAPDTPGNGDSEKLPVETPSIQDYATALLALVELHGLKRPHVYGSHTGSAIAAEMAIAAPERIGRVVLEGIGVFSPEQRAAVLEQYAKPFTPDLDGTHLIRAFNFCRDQYLFFPWYDRTAHATRAAGLPQASVLQAWVLEVLKAAETYPLAYRAAFRWPALDRMSLIEKDTLVIASEDDPLLAGTREAAQLLASGRFELMPGYLDPQFSNRRQTLITDFLGGAQAQ
jgi:pimeloyl-ACP methyl ester carboxylesterase